jgi:hypothetical protein
MIGTTHEAVRKTCIPVLDHPLWIAVHVYRPKPNHTTIATVTPTTTEWKSLSTNHRISRTLSSPSSSPNPFEQIRLAGAAAVDGAEHAIERLPAPQVFVLRRRQILQSCVAGQL